MSLFLLDFFSAHTCIHRKNFMDHTIGVCLDNIGMVCDIRTVLRYMRSMLCDMSAL